MSYGIQTRVAGLFLEDTVSCMIFLSFFCPSFIILLFVLHLECS